MMRKAWRTGWRIAAAAIFIALAVRFVWVASTTETGWGLIYSMARDTALDPVGLSHLADIHAASPERQAEYWLAEAERIIAENPNSAELAMGAAWMLDSHVSERSSWRMACLDLVRTQYGNSDGYERQLARFEGRALKRCAQLAERATQLDPGNVDYWRARVMLHVRFTRSGLAWRFDDTPEPLREAALHDPDNALYDYLLADHYWRRGAAFEYTTTSDEPPIRLSRLVIHDRASLERGNEHFERGCRKPLLAYGQQSVAATGVFLAKTHLPLHEQASRANNASGGNHLLTLSIYLHRRVTARANEATQQGDVRQAWRLFEQLVNVYSQLDAAREVDAYSLSTSLQARRWLNEMERLHRDHAAELPAGSAAFLAENFAYHARRQAIIDPMWKYEPYGAFYDLPMATATLPTAVSQALLAAALLAASIAACTLALSRVARLLALSTARRRLHTIKWHLVCWLAVAAIVAVVCGAFPGDLVSARVQQWIVLTSVTLMVVAAIAWRLIARPITVRTLLVWIALLCILFAIEGATSFARQIASGQMYLAPATFSFFNDADSDLRRFNLSRGDWEWCCIQWYAYQGPLVTLACALLAAAVFSLTAAYSPSPRGASLPVAARWRAVATDIENVLADMAKSAIVGAALLAIGYLALAPQFILGSNHAFQRELDYVRSPTAYWDRVDAEIGPRLLNQRAAAHAPSASTDAPIHAPAP